MGHYGCNHRLVGFCIMSGLFSKPKPPPPPPPIDPELIRRQKEQEARLERERAETARQITSRRRARSSAGRRQLLSDIRPNAQIGIEDDEELLAEFQRRPDV